MRHQLPGAGLFGGPGQACHGKQRYGGHAARRAARILNDRQLETVHPYPCPHCRRHHVGHTL